MCMCVDVWVVCVGYTHSFTSPWTGIRIHKHTHTKALCPYLRFVAVRDQIPGTPAIWADPRECARRIVASHCTHHFAHFLVGTEYDGTCTHMGRSHNKYIWLWRNYLLIYIYVTCNKSKYKWRMRSRKDSKTDVCVWQRARTMRILLYR